MIQVLAITKQGCFEFDCPIINYDECWIYAGPAYWVEGYPIINRHGKNWIASRFVWYFFTHRDYRSKDVHHKCHTRACINLFHLEELSRNKHSKYHNRRRNAPNKTPR